MHPTAVSWVQKVQCLLIFFFSPNVELHVLMLFTEFPLSLIFSLGLSLNLDKGNKCIIWIFERQLLE